MKKQLVIIGITLVLLAVGLSGCSENNAGSKFEGTWTSVEDGESDAYATLEVYSDGLFTASWSYQTAKYGGTWEANETHLKLNFTGFTNVPDYTVVYKYTFTNSETLVLIRPYTGEKYSTYKKS